MKSLFKNNHFVSELDQFLKAFDQTHPRLATSQVQEQQKYNRVYQLRDNKIAIHLPETLWDKF